MAASRGRSAPAPAERAAHLRPAHVKKFGQNTGIERGPCHVRTQTIKRKKSNHAQGSTPGGFNLVRSRFRQQALSTLDLCYMTEIILRVECAAVRSAQVARSLRGCNFVQNGLHGLFPRRERARPGAYCACLTGPAVCSDRHRQPYPCNGSGVAHPAWGSANPAAKGWLCRARRHTFGMPRVTCCAQGDTEATSPSSSGRRCRRKLDHACRFALPRKAR